MYTLRTIVAPEKDKIARIDVGLAPTAHHGVTVNFFCSRNVHAYISAAPENSDMPSGAEYMRYAGRIEQTDMAWWDMAMLASSAASASHILCVEGTWNDFSLDVGKIFSIYAAEKTAIRLDVDWDHVASGGDVMKTPPPPADESDEDEDEEEEEEENESEE